MESRVISFMPKKPSDIIKQSSSLTEIVETLNFGEWTPFLRDNISIIRENEKLLNKNCPSYFPLKKDIFRVFETCSPRQIKAVILGQDPYFDISNDGLPRATGLCFSVRKGTSIPPSLRNIFQELSKEGFAMDEKNGDLSYLSRRGVFLINSSLTVKEGSPGDHVPLWKYFTSKVIKYICEMSGNPIFMLWGSKAAEFEPYISGKGNILMTSHPSPQSVFRGFSGCNHFLECNKLLVSKNYEPINWSNT